MNSSNGGKVVAGRASTVQTPALFTWAHATMTPGPGAPLQAKAGLQEGAVGSGAADGVAWTVGRGQIVAWEVATGSTAAVLSVPWDGALVSMSGGMSGQALAVARDGSGAVFWSTVGMGGSPNGEPVPLPQGLGPAVAVVPGPGGAGWILCFESAIVWLPNGADEVVIVASDLDDSPRAPVVTTDRSGNASVTVINGGALCRWTLDGSGQQEWMVPVDRAVAQSMESEEVDGGVQVWLCDASEVPESFGAGSLVLLVASAPESWAPGSVPLMQYSLWALHSSEGASPELEMLVENMGHTPDFSPSRQQRLTTGMRLWVGLAPRRTGGWESALSVVAGPDVVVVSELGSASSGTAAALDGAGEAVVGGGLGPGRAVTLLTARHGALIIRPRVDDDGGMRPGAVGVSSGPLLGWGTVIRSGSGAKPEEVEAVMAAFRAGDGKGDAPDAVLGAASGAIIDGRPDSDPRWAEEGKARSSAATASVLLRTQLEDKQAAHNKFRRWLSRSVPEVDAHGEHIAAAVGFREAENSASGVVGKVIASAMQAVVSSRREEVRDGLSVADLFYASVSGFPELIPALASLVGRERGVACGVAAVVASALNAAESANIGNGAEWRTGPAVGDALGAILSIGSGEARDAGDWRSLGGVADHALRAVGSESRQRDLLRLFRGADAREVAFELAEKWQNHETLVAVAREDGSNERLVQLLNRYADSGLPEVYFAACLADGDGAGLLTGPASAGPWSDRLGRWLESHPSLGWIHGMRRGAWDEATIAAASVGRDETKSAGRARTAWSLAKLGSVLAEDEAAFHQADTELFVASVGASFGVQAASGGRPVSAEEVIEAAVSEPEAERFVVALDIWERAAMGRDALVEIWGRVLTVNNWENIANAWSKGELGDDEMEEAIRGSVWADVVGAVGDGKSVSMTRGLFEEVLVALPDVERNGSLKTLLYTAWTLLCDQGQKTMPGARAERAE